MLRNCGATVSVEADERSWMAAPRESTSDSPFLGGGGGCQPIASHMNNKARLFYNVLPGKGRQRWERINIQTEKETRSITTTKLSVVILCKQRVV